MENVIKNLLSRFWPMGALILGGFLLIIYIALGILYLQQGAQQRQFEQQIVKLSAILAKPLPSTEELQAQYEEANLALAPMTDYDAVGILVSIAEESGIDIDVASGKFKVPAATINTVTVGEGKYQVRSFSGIHVQGDYENVLAFISDLDSGKTLQTIVLKRVTTRQVEVEFTGTEAARRAEFREVASAVKAMMNDNGLSEIPNPINFAGGVATNLMGDDPDTEEVVEGFPDNTTTTVIKGYSGNATPRAGYVLYEHDKISTDNSTQFETVSYIGVLTTQYFYTCEADGTVRQFDGPYVTTATEYFGSEPSKMETIATVDVDIYTKPEE